MSNHTISVGCGQTVMLSRGDGDGGWWYDAQYWGLTRRQAIDIVRSRRAVVAAEQQRRNANMVHGAPVRLLAQGCCVGNLS